MIASEIATKDQSRLELRRRMALQRQIELRMNSLIERMTTLVDQETQVAQSRMEKHQIKNLLGVAMGTPSVQVVQHYILYQVGRDVAGNNWRHQEFGKSLVEALGSLKKDAEQIARGVHENLNLPDPDQLQIDEAWMWLVRAYLGQLNRYFYYQKEALRWQRATS